MNVQSIILIGRGVRLEPLSELHVSDLVHVGLDESIWRYMRYGNIQTEEDLHAWVKEMLLRKVRGTDLPFAVIHLNSERAIGATRYLNVQPHDRNLEIGGTWYGTAYQGTAVNTECKYLLLKHAFEDLGCIRVQIKTDSRNLRSQHAIEKLGAVREGLLRNHIINPDGYLRSSIVYSILDSEWPAVKDRLEARLRNVTLHDFKAREDT